MLQINHFNFRSGLQTEPLNLLNNARQFFHIRITSAQNHDVQIGQSFDLHIGRGSPQRCPGGLVRLGRLIRSGLPGRSLLRTE